MFESERETECVCVCVFSPPSLLFVCRNELLLKSEDPPDLRGPQVEVWATIERELVVRDRPVTIFGAVDSRERSKGSRSVVKLFKNDGFSLPNCIEFRGKEKNCRLTAWKTYFNQFYVHAFFVRWWKFKRVIVAPKFSPMFIRVNPIFQKILAQNVKMLGTTKYKWNI